jgi:hypothetical protein
MNHAPVASHGGKLNTSHGGKLNMFCAISRTYSQERCLLKRVYRSVMVFKLFC